jgi:hypothetical protein
MASHEVFSPGSLPIVEANASCLNVPEDCMAGLTRLKGELLTVTLNDKLIIENAQLPGVPKQGPLALQLHPERKDGEWGGFIGPVPQYPNQRTDGWEVMSLIDQAEVFDLLLLN